MLVLPNLPASMLLTVDVWMYGCISVSMIKKNDVVIVS